MVNDNVVLFLFLSENLWSPGQTDCVFSIYCRSFTTIDMRQREGVGGKEGGMEGVFGKLLYMYFNSFKTKVFAHKTNIICPIRPTATKIPVEKVELKQQYK